MSPSGIVSVCSGDSLELNCSTSGNILEWSFQLAPTTSKYTRALSTTNQPPEPISIDATRFTYSRLSAANSLPLVSTLSIDPVNMGLNGTVLNCTNVGTSETVTTIITIINEDWIEGIHNYIAASFIARPFCTRSLNILTGYNNNILLGIVCVSVGGDKV